MRCVVLGVRCLYLMVLWVGVWAATRLILQI